MADIQIYTALGVPTPAPQPSINSAQWSADGQLILCTKSAIFILTPDIGINFDNLSLLKTDRRNFHDSNSGSSSREAGLDLGWHRNLIELEKLTMHQWPSQTQEWGALSLGSLDISWRAVTISPSNLSRFTTGSGCLLVVMNTNLELTLWCATRNHLKEAWSKTQDITSTLQELPTPGNEHDLQQDRISYLKALQAQVHCISWSQQADFNVHPNPLVDASILALGNRTGSVVLMRYDSFQFVMQCDRVVRIADEWITHLAWSPWRAVQSFHSEAYLACGVADGSIIIARVRQRLEISQDAPVSPLSPRFYIAADVDVLGSYASDADGKGITALSWVNKVDNPYELPTIFHSKAGLFRFFQLQPPEPSAIGETEAAAPQRPRGVELATLRVQTQKASVDSSSFAAVSGLSRVTDPESSPLVVTLHDGSLHVVRNPCTAPAFVNRGGDDGMDINTDEEGTASLSSANLSRTARAVFVQAEGGTILPTDVCRISGANSFDEAQTIAWLHEGCQPTDFSYKHDARHNSMLVVASLWNNPQANESLLTLVKTTFEHPRSVLGYAPVHKLRPILLHLCQRKVFDVIWHRVLELIPTDISEGEIGGVIEPWADQINDVVRQAFRRSLCIDLYGWDSFLSLRLRLAVADYCWKTSSSDQTREQFGNVAQTLLNGISHRFIKIVVKHLIAVMGSLTEQDLPFLMRVIVQGLLDGSPQDLAAEAHTLNEAAKAKFTTVPPDAFGLSEPCPACRSPIPLENLLTAICPMGHVWSRCSITSFVLSTPMVRTCISCTRKAFLAPSSRARVQDDDGVPNTSAAGDAAGPSKATIPSVVWIPEAGRSWVVDELLEAARSCLYCGNRFVRIL
ncbi:transcription factor IIIC subunit delta N-term-domain-containing protein [Phellopilus nigrolimitatus]|nr:transcription factor IIIC subunit delta N-term-domain-containing protein [Phellopilus nigrolimitatus]